MTSIVPWGHTHRPRISPAVCTESLARQALCFPGVYANHFSRPSYVPMIVVLFEYFGSLAISFNSLALNFKQLSQCVISEPVVVVGPRLGSLDAVPCIPFVLCHLAPSCRASRPRFFLDLAHLAVFALSIDRFSFLGGIICACCGVFIININKW